MPHEFVINYFSSSSLYLLFHQHLFAANDVDALLRLLKSLSGEVEDGFLFFNFQISTFNFPDAVGIVEVKGEYVELVVVVVEVFVSLFIFCPEEELEGHICLQVLEEPFLIDEFPVYVDGPVVVALMNEVACHPSILVKADTVGCVE